jgi:hypothetical protein
MARMTQSTEFRYRDDSAMRAALLLGLAAMLFLASLVTGAWGIAALLHASWLDANELPVGGYDFWGVLLLALATFQGVTALLVLFGRPLGTYLGVVVAGINILAHVGVISAYPLWSVVGLAVNLAIIYALLAYGPKH